MRGERLKKRNRIISFVMAIAMVLTLVTVAPVTAQAAGVTNITIHFKNDWGWGTPALQYWDGTSTTVIGGATEEVPGWGGAKATMLNKDAENEGWYTITLQGNCDGFQLLDFSKPSDNTNGNVRTLAMDYCNDKEPTDIYFNCEKFLTKEDPWYLDSNFQTSIETKLPKQEEETYDPATLVGDFSALTFTNEDEKIGNWNPADTNGDMVYVGNDVYAKTIHFKPLNEEASVQYKVAFNHAWDESIGENGTSDNVTLSIPAGTSYLTVVCDHKNRNLYNSVTNGADTTGDTVSIIGTVRDNNTWVETYEGTEYDFVKLSNRYYVYQKAFKAGSYQYKAVFNHKDWASWDNITLKLLNDKVVTFVYDAETGNAYDSVNNLDKVIEALTAEPQNIEKRWALVEYDRLDGDYEGWNIYCWNSGFSDGLNVKVDEFNGKHYLRIPVKASEADMTLSFCMRKSTTENEWAEKDGGDHYITFPADQKVVIAKFQQGQGITSVLPYNKGYEMKGAENKVAFYYRDDALMQELNESSLSDKVSVVVNGTTYPMTFDKDNQRYVYELEGCTSGKYMYRYIVNGEEVVDPLNESGAFSYKHFDDLTLEASFGNATMDYNDNNVLSVSFKGTDATNIDAKSELASITADLSELGGKTLDVNTELLELSASVRDSVSAGNKSVPVVAKDIYGNVYRATAEVTVTKRDTDTFDWDEAVIYMTCTDRFFDGNTKNDEGVNKSGSLSYHGGDFAGLEQKLDYLQNLGVNTIWITPIVENVDTDTDNGYHGYWAKDFTKLNPYLGTEEELESLINALHKRGMKLMVDVVLNHAGYGTEDYFNSILKDQDGNSISMIRDKDTTITGDDVRDSLSGLPDFVTENADVRNQLVEWQTEWMTKYDIDYYRVDTVKHVDATTWAAFKNSLTKANPDFKMIGEYAGAGYANTAGELGTGTMDSLLDFDFNDKAEAFVTGDINSVESFFQSRNASIDNTATMGGFLSSHDEDSLVDKLVTEKNLTEEEALKVFKVAAALQLTAKGQAVIYYGEEIGQHGLNNYPIQSNRYDFDWNQVDTQSADANSMLNHYEKLLSIRTEYKKLFARGDRSSVLASDDDGYDVFTRSYNGTKLYVGLNIKDADQTISIPVSEAAGSTMTDLYSGKIYTVSTDGKVEITIPKAVDGGTVILKKETSSNGGSSSSTGTTETVKNDTTTVTNPDGSKTETTVIKDLPADTKASLNVTTDANGNKTSEAAVETKGTEKKSGVSTSVSADVVKAITDKAKTTDVTIKQEVKKADGSTAYTVEVSAGDVKAGETLKLLKKDAKTGELVLVNKKDYTVSADGSVDLTIKNSGEYVLLNSKDAKAAVKEIKKTVKATKTSTNVKKKKTTKFPWSKKLNMENVDKITYTSSKKSVVTVNKNGKITAKKKGTAKVKAVVTLKDGTKKTVTMKVKVK